MSVDQWEDSLTWCPDEECIDSDTGLRSIAEPDGDGDLHYYACDNCGYEFGYERITPDTLAVDEDGSCSIGVPAEVRKAASAGMEASLAAQQRKELPVLQIGRRPSE